MADAPRRVPSPPMQNSIDTRSRISVSTITAGSCGPRRRGEDGSAVGVHVGNDVSSQLERRELARIGESGEAVAVAEDPVHAVAVTHREGQRPQYVVEPGAQPAARDHRRRHVTGFEGEPATWSGLLEGGWRASVFQIRSEVASVRRAQHRRSVIDELRKGGKKGARPPGRPDAGDGQVIGDREAGRVRWFVRRHITSDP